jgi:hypothetical protein
MRFRGVVRGLLAVLALSPAAGWTQDVREITGDGDVVAASSYQNEPPDLVNPPENGLDNDISTRWSAEGDNEWLRVDLGMVRPVSGVHVAVFNGNARQAIFDVQVSDDGTSWTNVLTNVYSSGTTDQEEAYVFTEVSARYVRYLGHMNTVNAWNSVTEFCVLAPNPEDVALEGESLEVLGSSGDNAHVDNHSGASGGQVYIMDSNQVGDYVEFKIPNLSAGVYNVVLGLKSYWTRGIIQVSIGDVGGPLTNLGDATDLYEETAFADLNLGAWKASTTGDKVLRLQVVDRNPDSNSPGHTLSLDYVRFE